MSQPQERFWFGRFCLDAYTGVLTKNGMTVSLGSTATELLLYLVRHPGRLVTHEELEQVLWPDSDAEVSLRNPLQKHIGEIRFALEDNASRPHYVRTEHRKGYRFHQPVRRDEISGSAPHSPPHGGANDPGMRDILASIGESLPERTSRLLREAIQLMARKGNAAPEVKEKLTEAMALCAQTDRPHFFIALQWLCLHLIMQGQLQAASDIGSSLPELAASLPSAYEKAAHDTFGVVVCFLGECRKGLGLLELGPAPGDQDAVMPMVSFTDPRVSRLCYMAHASYALGYPEQACRLMDQALELADGTFDARSLVFCCQFGAALYQLLRKPEIVQAWATRAIQSGKGWPLQPWPASGMVLKGWALAQQGAAAHGIGLMEQGIKEWEASGARIILPRLYILLAEAYGDAGRVEAGLRTLQTALEIMESTGDRHYAAETHRMRGVLLLKQRT
jgi:DNA-binding winged helix-turn-helix (wHTH) protein